MTRELLRGNDVIAEAAIRAGCRFYAGYPITPQNHIVEYMAKRMPEVGGTFIQANSELAAISMAYGACAAGFRTLSTTSGPGFSLKHEGISYIASAELPCVIVDVQRFGSGLGDVFQGQCDYFAAVKCGGHGDYRLLVYAPWSIQETADLIALSFAKAEEYRNPVLLLTDACLGQMMEPVELPPLREHDPDQFAWSAKGKHGGPHRKITSNMYYIPEFPAYNKAKYDNIAAREQRYESYMTGDAELILVAYGISARIAYEAAELGRRKGLKLGLVRPVSLWPFPTEPFRNIPAACKAFLTVELSSLGKICEDVALASRCALPIYASLTGDRIPYPDEIVRRCEEALAGKIAAVI